MQARFDIVDGIEKPRIFFHPKARRHDHDERLSGIGKPTSTLEELGGYVWDTKDPDRVKDEPVKKDDHGMDQARYVCRYAETYDDGAAHSAANAPRVGKKLTDSLRPGTFRK